MIEIDWPSHWRGRTQFTLFDAAYGDGAAFRAVLEAWRNDPQRPARLHYIGLGSDPLPGFRRIPQLQAEITLDVLSASLDQALGQLDARLDAVALSGVAQAGSRFAHALGRLAAPGALLVAEGLNYDQKAALAHAGFSWEGEGGTRARYASRRPQPAPRHPDAAGSKRAIVLGAGLAGSAACERLCARGWQVTLVERHAHPAAEASGNLAGIGMPLLSKDDNLMTRLSRAAFRYALDYVDLLGGVGADGAIMGERCGVLQLARDAGHAQVQRAIAGLHRYPREYAEWLERAQAEALLGAGAPDGGWLFRQGGWTRPSSLCGAMLSACGDRLERRFGAGSVGIERGGQQWRVLAGDGSVIAQAPVLVLANGTGVTALEQGAALPLAAVRGQVTHLAAGAVPALPFVLCREAYLTPAVGGLHSLGASYDDDDDPALSARSQAENLDKVRALLGEPAIGTGAPLQGRVGFRCVAPDRLPLVGALPETLVEGRIERAREVPRQDGLFGLLGYASRGLTWAPLAAELLAAQLGNEPLPLETDLVQALDPARFVLRERRAAAKAR